MKPILHWAPRIWSLLILGLVVVTVITPDPYASEPISSEDWFLLSLWGIAVLGLFIAWKWALLGAAVTVGMMFIRELSWLVLKGRWFPGFLIMWFLLVPPAVLFVLDWRAHRIGRNP
jgi:hypothetical protein